MEELHIYLRVSSDVQMEDGFGIDNQKELGLKVSKIKGMKPIIHNEGSKSSNLETIEHRPILKNLLLKIEEGDVKNLWVYQMDRLSRNDVVSFQIRQIIKKNNVKLFVNDSNEYNLENPSDKLMFTIMEGISEFDNSIRTERLRRGKLSKIKSGGWRGGPPPFGYQNVDGKLVPQTYEKRWVRKIYEEYGGGSSIYQIRKYLMKNGVVSRRGNIIWSDQSIRKILENTHYEGYHFYSDKKLKENVRCECPKILPSTLVKKVRKRLSETTFKSNYIKYETLLRDFLVCGHCGSKYGQRISKSQYKNHYFCRGNGEKYRVGIEGKNKRCEIKGSRVRSLFIDTTDKSVWDNVIDVIEKSHLFKEIFKKETMVDKKSFGKSMFEIKKYEKRIKQNEIKIKDIEDIINSNKVDGILDKNNEKNFHQIIKKFEEKKTEILSENEELNNLIYENKNTKKWIHWIDEFKDKIHNLRDMDLSDKERKKFLNGVIEKIEVFTVDNRTHKLDIKFNSPYVNDSLIWNVKGKPNKGYKVIEGKKNFNTLLNQIDGQSKKKISI
tara:strand:- start:555 stop:2210 length:1656 start_codon:yes stop_codon:yes gene_type:complete